MSQSYVYTIDRRETRIVGALTLIVIAFMHSCTMEAQPTKAVKIEHPAPAPVPVKKYEQPKGWDI